MVNGIALGYFTALIFAPSLTWLPASANAPFRLLWYILVQLFQLARGGPEQQSKDAANIGTS